MKNYLLLGLAVWLMASSCNQADYGTRVEIGESEVFYKGKGVTEKDAKEVGDFLVKNKIFDKKKKSSAQVLKEDGIYVVRIIMDPKKTEESINLNLWRLQSELSAEVFNDEDARFAFADERFKELEALPPIGKIEVGGGQIFYDNSEFKKAEAKKLGDFLLEQKYMAEGRAADVILTKEDDVPVVRFIYDETVGKKENILLTFSYMQDLIRKDVLDKGTQLVLTNVQYEDFKKIPKLTAEQRQEVENQYTNNNQPATDSTESSSGVLRLPNY